MRWFSVPFAGIFCDGQYTSFCNEGTLFKWEIIAVGLLANCSFLLALATISWGIRLFTLRSSNTLGFHFFSDEIADLLLAWLIGFTRDFLLCLSWDSMLTTETGTSYCFCKSDSTPLMCLFLFWSFAKCIRVSVQMHHYLSILWLSIQSNLVLSLGRVIFRIYPCAANILKYKMILNCPSFSLPPISFVPSQFLFLYWKLYCATSKYFNFFYRMI